MTSPTVLLVSANTETVPAPVYPLPLARLAGALGAAGYAVWQHDILVHGLETLPAAIAETKPALVGISIRNIDNVDATESRCYVDDYRGLIARIRRHTDSPVVLGGSGFSIFPEELTRQLGADYGVFGAGEEPLLALLEVLAGDGDPAAIPNVIAPDEAPASTRCAATYAPASLHSPELIEYYWQRGGMIGLETKRGCPRKCSYCTYPLIGGAGVQWREPGDVADEMERLITDHGVTYFFMVDSVFNLDASKEAAFAEEVCRRGVKCSWGAFFAPTRMDRGYVETLKESGLTHVEFGTDSLSETMLESYRKGFLLDDVRQAAAVCSELKVHCAHYLILGGPGETEDTLIETINHADRLCDGVIFPFAGVRVYPNTPLYDTALAGGLVSGPQDCLNQVFYLAPGMTPDSIWAVVDAYKKPGQRWILPSAYEKLMPIMNRLRERGAKGPLWEYAMA